MQCEITKEEIMTKDAAAQQQGSLVNQRRARARNMCWHVALQAVEASKGLGGGHLERRHQSTPGHSTTPLSTLMSIPCVAAFQPTTCPMTRVNGTVTWLSRSHDIV